MSDLILDDGQARLQALEPDASFIVQAPAGSGKTGLLVKRFLVLLARVDAPEEVLAITFTRKAAAEMRARILAALQEAARGAAPQDSHEQDTWALAGAALQRDSEMGWQLLQNPMRLRVQTIDSLNTTLARQMPVLARAGAVPSTVDRAEPLYREAAQRTLRELEEGGFSAPAIRRLVMHLDNDLPKVESLLANMLVRREQWLRHMKVPGRREDDRAQLETAIGAAVQSALQAVVTAMPPSLVPELLAVAQFAGHNVPPEHRIAACADLHALPCVEPDDVQAWQSLADLLLTADGGWRKRVNTSVGFPAEEKGGDAARNRQRKEMKQRVAALLDALREEHVLRESLEEVRQLPPPRYSDAQWELLHALFQLLSLAVAQLRLVFSERGQVDFSEIAHMAREALGDADAPTDLALALDYRIQHILVDEFQDTSFSQYALLSALTAGWMPDDGRSLFLVGDPMQSIYRFREAEVGLFLWARQHGIGSVRPRSLRLTSNFRSEQGIVEWVNQTFSVVFPAAENVATGAVPYSASQPVRPAAPTPAVEVHPFFGLDRAAEAQRVVKLIQRAQAEHPQGTIAVLVRSRRHLAHIAVALRAAGIPSQAIDIEPLAGRPLIQDLLSLTRALEHLGDRAAWLALLRAPWCALSLNDLHALAADDHQAPIWTLMQEAACIDRLSTAGRRRLIRLRDALAPALAQRGRASLRRWVEAVWLALGGPACVQNHGELRDAATYLDLLDALDARGEALHIDAVADAVAALYAAPSETADGRVQLMTIHKSKGLEFDTVILPGLASGTQSDESRLLLWVERPSLHGEGDLLLAPIHAAETAKKDELLYAYLSHLDKEKARHEDARLLYVAATRAKRQLHLLGHVNVTEKEGIRQPKAPPSGSLLAMLWPVLEAHFRAAIDCENERAAPVVAPAANLPALWRLRDGWCAPPLPAAAPMPASTLIPVRRHILDAQIEYLWATPTARHVGTVVHRLLRGIALEGAHRWSPARIEARRSAVQRALTAMGVPQGDLHWGVDRVIEAIYNTLHDQRGNWLLRGDWEDSRCEYAVSGMLDGELVHAVIDRTFVDEQGTRWIVDYKSGYHGGSDRAAFLDQEQVRYSAQLANYAQLMEQLDNRPIRLGLYFPLLQGWREWSAASSPSCAVSVQE